MKAMVLAAGKGTRLYPLTGEIPKPMAPVAGKPVIQYIFELLADANIEEINVNVHYLADSILEVYGLASRVRDTEVYLSREEKLLGTAGSVKRLDSRFDKTFLVVMGDALTDVDLRKLVAFHRERDAAATLALMRVPDTSQYGVVELNAERNIVGFQEKPHPSRAKSNLANTGIYVLEPRVLGYIPENSFFDFAEDVFPRLLEAGERLAGFEGDFYWSDIGTLEAYRTAQRDVLSGKVSVKIPGEKRSEGLWVEHGVDLHPTVVFEGRAVLQKHAVIGRGVTLVGDVVVGSGCQIQSGATVKRSILLPRASVGQGAYLENCIIGPGYNVGAREYIRGDTLVGACRQIHCQNSGSSRRILSGFYSKLNTMEGVQHEA